ncbi:hypothetical protein JR316_0007899 [Psilocybe cubensis]|uniref:Uncharacterized protein n=2 Tax=Psilocybe cubensis TaxID=181762 RepID=A0ACB8GV05_PSICU|nr:hypothetical protein JR316_0007899 [Psilocybe cubensis]KAH9479310.1 hypothetical protein JR316_0007899 [Psilocybe cubensis]
MSSDGAESRPTTHANFDHNNTNGSGDRVTFISSDRVLFNLHRKNLDVTAGVFPGPEFVFASAPPAQESTAIPLQEPACVLEILFQFVYPDRRAKLTESLEFAVLAQVAETAEKYQIYSAIDACEQEFERRWLPQYALPILTHALKHGIIKLIDASALCLCITPISEVLNQGLPLQYAARWSKYHEDCRNLLFKDAEAELGTLYLSMELDNTHRSCVVAALDWMYDTSRKIRSLNDIEHYTYKPDRYRHDEFSPRCSIDLDMSGEQSCYVLEQALVSVKRRIVEIKEISFWDCYIKPIPAPKPMPQ